MILDGFNANIELVIGIIGGVLGIIGTGLGIFGLTTYINERMKHKAQKKNKKEDEEEQKKLEDEQKAAEAAHKKYMDDLRAIIKEENKASVAPLEAQMEKFSNKLNIVADGTTDILRERLLSCYYKCMKKGYRTQYDYENVDHMFREYKSLNGNSFVEECVKKIKALPSEEEYLLKKKQNSRRAKAKKAPANDNAD